MKKLTDKQLHKIIKESIDEITYGKVEKTIGKTKRNWENIQDYFKELYEAAEHFNTFFEHVQDTDNSTNNLRNYAQETFVNIQKMNDIINNKLNQVRKFNNMMDNDIDWDAYDNNNGRLKSYNGYKGEHINDLLNFYPTK